MSSPPTNICPLVTLSIVEIQLSKVVFPLPEAPIMATNSPSSTSNEILSIAFVRFNLFP